MLSHREMVFLTIGFSYAVEALADEANELELLDLAEDIKQFKKPVINRLDVRDRFCAFCQDCRLSHEEKDQLLEFIGSLHSRLMNSPDWERN